MSTWQILFWALFGLTLILFLAQNLIFPMLRKNIQKKSFDKQKEAVSEIKKGASVITTFGVYGNITRVHKNDFDLEIAKGVIVRCSKSVIAGYYKEKIKIDKKEEGDENV